MDIPFTIPQSLWPLFIGLIALGVGAWLVSLKSLLVRLLGLVIALGGVSFLLTPIPNSWVSPGVKFIVVILVFIALSAEIARSKWKTDRAAKLTGAVLAVLGVLALIVQVMSYFSVPTGSLQQVITTGFDNLSRIFNLAGKQLD